MVSKAISSYVKRPNNHSAFQNSCIMFTGHFFLLCAPSIGKCDLVVFLSVWTVCIPQKTPFNLNYPCIIIIYFVLCTRKPVKRFIK